MSEKTWKKFEAALFVEELKRQGIITPAQEKIGMGMTAFLEFLAQCGDQAPFEYMKEFLELLPQTVYFEETPELENDGIKLPEDWRTKGL
ncbi:MAG: hypothetical protein M0Z52_03830 [Actinomycetota bacterium]|nr:hypothetical protein [Actinomycetota bacterium]